MLKVQKSLEWIGKNLALLQAEASACGLGLANVPNVCWLIISFSLCSKIFIIVFRSLACW